MSSPRPSSNIPEARERLLAIADQLRDLPFILTAQAANEIEWIVQELMIRGYTNIPVARKRRDKLTPARAAQIRAYKRINPDALQDDIGKIFNVGGGRVSEALAGHDWSPSRTGQKT